MVNIVRLGSAAPAEALAPLLANGHIASASIAVAVLRAQWHVAVYRPTVDVTIAVDRADGQIKTFAIGCALGRNAVAVLSTQADMSQLRITNQRDHDA
eukprot:CAMPEP_0197722992 /NCGR_PEP_ID=MMETSP1434-20131217/5468_1 /TAXON_ID=265543 /ORGANISM="Minutocellus polymorphus, Strain CCMP3303" /LENGTH=97 /DNA_ID=CAMNT_0043308191 /DNA_START=276 /DNA_END=565 /DNA_ORIENTATION=+